MNNLIFAHTVGKKTTRTNLPVKHFAMELLESFTHFDTKFVATFKDLVFKPGLVIQKFNDNKRVRYVPPIRIYAFTSFAFFLFFSAVTSSEIENMSVAVKKSPDKTATIGVNVFGTNTKIDTLTRRELEERSFLTNELIDSTLRSKNIPTNWLNTRIVNTATKLNKGELPVADLFNKFVKYTSYSIFILMPIFAFLLLFFYRKRNYFYAEFLVFSIYFHTLIFGAFIFLLLIFGFIPISNKLNYIALILFVGMTIYLGLALKRVFADSTPKTILKTALLSLSYLVSLFIAAVVLVLGSVI